MKQGNWVPISKALVSALPKDRPFTELEAMFSLAVDYDNGNGVSISGLAARWRWSRNRVRLFLGRIGVAITYAGNKFSPSTQKGQVTIQVKDKSGTGEGQVIFIDSRWLQEAGDRSGTGEGQVRDRWRATTTDPNPNPNPKKKGSSAEKIREQVAALSQRYDQKLFREAVECIAATRKSGKLADSIILAQLKRWEKLPVEQVERGLRTYIDKGYWEEGKDEKYLWGIIRRADKPTNSLTTSNQPVPRPTTYRQAQLMERRAIASALLEKQRRERERQHGTADAGDNPGTALPAPGEIP